MRFVLACNTLEHSGFAQFVHDVGRVYPDASILVCGDLLNIFPEPGEDLESSIFYEIYGDFIVEEMERIKRTRFSNLEQSRFVEPLREIFGENGRTYRRAKAIASRRYARVFAELRLAMADQELYFIPGNMDYPLLSTLFAATSSNIYQLDGDIVTVGGVRLGGVGGIPHTAQPFHGVADISPYEMTEAAYERRLADVWGADVVMTHLSPEESPLLEAFVRESPVRMLVCRAPFDFKKAGSCRGESVHEHIEGKTVLKIRPFEYPHNSAFVVDFSPGLLDEPVVERFEWHAPASLPRYDRFRDSVHAY